jgi:hypothetical protein
MRMFFLGEAGGGACGAKDGVGRQEPPFHGECAGLGRLRFPVLPEPCPGRVPGQIAARSIRSRNDRPTPPAGMVR